MKNVLATTIVGALAVTSPAALPAQRSDDGPTARPAQRLQIGDPAPALQVEAFLKGEAIPELARGTVYVIEFWATWCAPCVRQMPHLSAMQREFQGRGVRIVGVDCREMRRVGPAWERHFDVDEVRRFVARQGDRIGYTIAFDGEDAACDDAWMRASNSGGLPTAFVVDRDGRVAWIGHPAMLRLPLRAVVDGSWDLTNGPAEVAAIERSFLDAIGQFGEDGNAGLRAWRAAARDHPRVARDLVGAKFDALVRAGRCADAWRAAEQVVLQAAAHRDAVELSRVAWTIVDPDATHASRDLGLALTAARIANVITEGGDADVQRTLARAWFAIGDVEQAIAHQREALRVATPQGTARLSKTLEQYERTRR